MGEWGSSFSFLNFSLLLLFFIIIIPLTSLSLFTPTSSPFSSYFQFLISLFFPLNCSLIPIFFFWLGCCCCFVIFLWGGVVCLFIFLVSFCCFCLVFCFNFLFVLGSMELLLSNSMTKEWFISHESSALSRNYVCWETEISCADWYKPHYLKKKYSGYDIKLKALVCSSSSDLKNMECPSLPLLPGPLWLEAVVPFRVSSMVQLDLFENYSY